MKQTLEEAAYDYATNKTKFRKEVLKEVDPDNYVSRKSDCMEDFQCGAEWHAKQSPWISMKERLPEDTNEKLVMLVDGTIRIAHYDEDYNEDMEYHFWYDCAASESYHRDDVIYWMPIPSFDEILEANRDVLERIKEKEVNHG